VSPAIQKTSLNGIIASNFLNSNVSGQNIKSELVISTNLLNDCAARLCWEVNHFSNGGRVTWIDATSGSMLKSSKSDMDVQHEAETEIYGTQFMDDKTTTAGVTTLESPDGSIRIFDITSQNLTYPDASPSAIESGVIPTKNSTIPKWTTETSKAAYQAFYVISREKPIFKSLGIDFKKINVGLLVTDFNAAAKGVSTLDNTYFVIGKTPAGVSLALYDVIGHELGHVFLRKYLDYTQSGNQSLHEGISDIIGTYMESQNTPTDWILGDEVTDISNFLNRDLQNPGNNGCFTSVSSNPIQHIRGQPIGHLFFLLSNGDAASGIPALGMKTALNIVLDAVKMVSPEADYPNLRTAMISLLDDNVSAKYGRCSNAMTAVVNAWAKICLPIPPLATCKITGESIVCEESNKMDLCANFNSANRWTFPFGWTVTGGNANSNSVENQKCLHVTHFPKYDYYPRNFTVELYDIVNNKSYYKVCKLIDCNHDDPTCEQYISGFANHGDDRNATPSQFEFETVEIGLIKVFDTTGRLLFIGNQDDFSQKIDIFGNRLLFVAYFDSNGNYLTTSKKIFFN
jgi:hypothetical protein